MLYVCESFHATLLPHFIHACTDIVITFAKKETPLFTGSSEWYQSSSSTK